jgi:hypothetical protein
VISITVPSEHPSAFWTPHGEASLDDGIAKVMTRAALRINRVAA